MRRDATPDMGYVSTLLGVEPIKAAEYKKKELELGESVRQQQDVLLKQAFIASLLQNAKIKVNDKLLNR